MPADWHPEALKVQAVAARTYALVSRKPKQAFDVYADTRSQVYGGIEAERRTTNAAVGATRGQVVEFKGKIAWTFFSASSGGKTAAISDVWKGSEQLPYLVSVEDPFDDVCPYHSWGPLQFTAAELRAELGNKIPGGLESLTVERNASGRVDFVAARGGGRTTQISGSEMRSALGLRSTWFRIDEAVRRGVRAAAPCADPGARRRADHRARRARRGGHASRRSRRRRVRGRGRAARRAGHRQRFPIVLSTRSAP